MNWGSPEASKVLDFSDCLSPAPWHDNSNVFPSYALPHVVPIVTVWNDTCELWRVSADLFKQRQFVYLLNFQGMIDRSRDVVPSLSRIAAICPAFVWTVSSSAITRVVATILVCKEWRPIPPNATSVHGSLMLALFPSLPSPPTLQGLSPKELRSLSVIIYIYMSIQ
jgi:hypothetical protein